MTARKPLDKGAPRGVHAMIDPGPPGDPEVNRLADEWVAACMAATRAFHTPKAAAWVRANPPSAEAIARLAWVAHKLEKAEAARKRQEASVVARTQNASHKSVTIAAMRTARAAGMATLDLFLESAAVGSAEALDIKRKEERGVYRWTVVHDELKDAKTVARSTLAGWWTTAMKSGIAR